MGTDTDRIQKRVTLKAPLERVWKAVSDSSRFGEWFGVAFEGPFVAGKAVRGKILPTKADPEIARTQEPYAGAPFDCIVDRIEPMTLFSFRWHPFAIDPSVDYSKEPTTLVTFQLEPVPGGTQLTITESGFDSIPVSRRAKAFQMNDQGWTGQMNLIEKYLATHAS
ncbi:MAG TPA: SRPBCC family protein [Polyangiaceae bacterium]|nr:SRPBCC family protein [Polyangiaceae bacterium]